MARGEEERGRAAAGEGKAGRGDVRHSLGRRGESTIHEGAPVGGRGDLNRWKEGRLLAR